MLLMLLIPIVEANDPFEDINRKVWAFNEFLDDNLAKPTAEIYTSIAPNFVEVGMSNFFRNLNELDNNENNFYFTKEYPLDDYTCKWWES